VTLVAVFLALGLGVLFGASFIDQKTVSGLQKSQKRLAETNKSRRHQIVALQNDNSVLESFATASRDLLIRGALKDRPAVVLSFQSTPDKLISEVEETLVGAGAKLEGSIRISDNLDLTTDERRRKVAAALQLASPESKDLTDGIVSGLVDALSSRRPGYVQKLIDGGLASSGQPPGAAVKPPGELAAPGSAVVLLPPGPRDTSQRALLLPLIKSLSAFPVLTAVAQPDSVPGPLMQTVRGDANLKVITIDGLDEPLGQAGLALGLKAAYAGSYGHYGTGKSATSLLPPVPTPPA